MYATKKQVVIWKETEYRPVRIVTLPVTSVKTFYHDYEQGKRTEDPKRYNEVELHTTNGLVLLKADAAEDFRRFGWYRYRWISERLWKVLQDLVLESFMVIMDTARCPYCLSYNTRLVNETERFYECYDCGKGFKPFHVDCPKCGSWRVVVVSEGPDYDTVQCLACGHTWMHPA